MASPMTMTICMPVTLATTVNAVTIDITAAIISVINGDRNACNHGQADQCFRQIIIARFGGGREPGDNKCCGKGKGDKTAKHGLYLILLTLCIRWKGGSVVV